MTVEQLADYVFASKYSRYVPELKRRETWEESVDRVMDMHKRRFEGKGVDKEIEEIRRLMKAKKLLGSQRAMQFGGSPIEKNNAKIYNCSASYCDRPRFFAEAMWLLLCGCGVGFSVQKHHVERLQTVKKPLQSIKIFQPEDSIEGWADCLDELIMSYFNGSETVKFDLSTIRPKGSAIAGISGKAPGPEPLRIALEQIRSFLDKLVENGEHKLKPIEAYDIVMFASDAVLAGGVRRSSAICLFSKGDEEMQKAKTGNWFIENPQRARSNNSVVLLRDEVTEDEFLSLIDDVRQFGEPGFAFFDDRDIVVNPCQPGFATVLTPDGIRTFDDIDVGSKIWSSEGWTTVIKKWSNGVKPVYSWAIGTDCCFIGTKNHRVLSSGQKTEIGYLHIGGYVDVFYRELDKKTFQEDIRNISFVGDHEVFDITVDNESHTYWTGGVNVSNCFEIGMYPQYEGESGFSKCNLSEINIANVEDEQEFYHVAKHASYLGTLQADYTDLKYLGEVSKKIIEREALIGVSMTGMAEKPEIAFNADIQSKGAEVVKQANAEIAKKIGINPAARTTCIKPSGSAACVLGTSSGIHPHHAKRYFRRAQATNDEPIAQFFQLHNPTAVEKSVWNKNGRDVVITFCVESKEGSNTKKELSALQLLKLVKRTKKNWVDGGKNIDLCVNKTTSHNVSNTINIKDNDSWEDVAKYIYKNRHFFTGVSLLPDSGDLDYPQAPFSEVLTHDEIVQRYGVGSLFASGLIVDGLHAFDGNLWAACDCAIGRGESIDSDDAKKDWVRRCKKFANNFLHGDVVKLTRCLKHVNNCKLWEDLQREYIDVDYSKLIEDQDNTKTEQSIACSGGTCEVI